jgi:hypothetical protein
MIDLYEKLAYGALQTEPFDSTIDRNVVLCKARITTSTPFVKQDCRGLFSTIAVFDHTSMTFGTDKEVVFELH